MTTQHSTPVWAIILTGVSQEEVAERSVRQAGYRVYLPRYRRLLAPHGTTRRLITSMRPLITGVMFVQDWRGFPHNQPLTGVIRPMQGMRAATIASLSDSDVAILMRRERDLEFDDVKRPLGDGKTYIREDIKPGDAVEGDALGRRLEGVLEELSEDGSATIRALVFGRETIIRGVPAETLTAINS